VGSVLQVATLTEVMYFASSLVTYIAYMVVAEMFAVVKLVVMKEVVAITFPIATAVTDF